MMKDQYKRSEENERIKELNTEIRQQELYIKEISTRLKERRQEFKEYSRFNDFIGQQNELNYLKNEVERLRKQRRLMDRTVGKQNNAIRKFEKETEETMEERVSISVLFLDKPTEGRARYVQGRAQTSQRRARGGGEGVS